MKTKRSLSVRTRLITGFGVVLIALIALAVVAIVQVQDVRKKLDDIIDVNGVKERYAINFRGSVHDRSIALRDVILVAPSELPAVVDHIKTLKADYDQSDGPFNQIFAEDSSVTSDEQSIYARINAARSRTLPLIDQVVSLQSTGNPEVARKILLDSARPALVEWLAAINAMIDFEQSLSEREGAEARQISVRFKVFMTCLTALASILSAVVALLVVRHITRALGADPQEMIVFAEAIRNGDLTRVSRLRDGDATSVMATVTKMRDDLSDIVEQVRQAAHGVAGASREIAEGNGDLGKRTSSQAAALEQATNALTEFDASVSANATNAGHADELAKQASVTASDGGDAVGRVVETMRGINASSSRIGEIISVINSIAFQTNILALNAAVEAARAGPQGRGFAVVAAEVRILAQRSAEAAKEIKSLVQESSDRVNAGTQLVDAAGVTIADVVASSSNVTTIMGEIHEACRLQTQQIGEVRSMIDHLERSTQQNVALVEQSGSAAETLLSQADQLLQVVDVFRLKATASTHQITSNGTETSTHQSGADLVSTTI